jgi:hypothetical protein
METRNEKEGERTENPRMASNLREFDEQRFGDAAHSRSKRIQPAPTGAYLALGALSGLTIFSAFVPFMNFFMTPILAAISVFYGRRVLYAAD